eukprot:114561_1
MVIGTPSIQWYIGVSLAFSADIVGNVGVQILKIAHCRMLLEKTDPCITSLRTTGSPRSPVQQFNDKLLLPTHNTNTVCYHSTIQPNRKRKKIRELYICNPLWITGTVLQFLGSILDFFAVGFAPQSVVAPIGSLVVVINLIFTAIFQKETPSKTLIYTTTIVVMGSLITTFSSPKEELSYQTVNALVELYSSIYFIFYALLIGVALISLLVYHKYCKKYKAKYALEYERKYFKSHRFTVGTMSGIMGAQNILFAKGVSSMIVIAVSNDTSCFVYWEWYLLLVAMLCTVWFQLKWLNYGLKHFSPMQIIPVFQSFWTLVGILGGLIVYQEFDDFTNVKNQCMFALGCVFIIGGILYLTTLDKSQKRQSKIITDGHSINDIGSLLSDGSTESDELDYFNHTNNKLNINSCVVAAQANNLIDSGHTDSR